MIKKYLIQREKTKDKRGNGGSALFAIFSRKLIHSLKNPTFTGVYIFKWS